MTDERDERILAALREAAPAAASGEAIAASLGMSRAAVAKRVSGLRAAGYDIAAEAGAGYRLLAAPDLPLPSEVAPLLRSGFWVRLTGGGSTGSTNDDAKALARAGAPEGTVVLAAEQTAGRGRLGRAWASPHGGVYVSVVLRPPLAPADAAPLALVVGVGLARGFATLGAETGLKWPNDVVLGGGKVAGVLLETSAEADRAEWVVAGCGVNVRRSPGAPASAAFLADATPDATPLRLAAVAAACLDGIASAYGDFATGGFVALAEEYASRDVLAGRDVTVRDGAGEVRATGVAEGVDGSGRLIIEGQDGEVAVAAGEVTLRPDVREAST